MTEPVWLPFNELYNIEGQQICTHSMIKTMRRCPNMARYKYLERLKPRVSSQPLERGKWMHALFEAYYKGENWKTKHKELTRKYNELFDEEKEMLGDLPTECLRLMQSYLWHYGGTADQMHGWEIIAVEAVVECMFPDGTIYRGKVDMVVRDQYGVWIVDHKTHKTLPDFSFRLLDVQSGLYLWALLNGFLIVNDEPMSIKVDGFIWNYVRTKAPVVPQLAYANDPARRRLSKRRVETDYPTMRRAITDYDLDPEDYRPQLMALKRDRWTPDATQTSPFFRREMLNKADPMLARIADEAFHTAQRMESYDFDRAERVVDRSCKFACSYNRLCMTELFGGNADQVRRQGFRVGNPHDYAYDDEPKSLEIRD
jgi:hypothetical protein